MPLSSQIVRLISSQHPCGSELASESFREGSINSRALVKWEEELHDSWLVLTRVPGETSRNSRWLTSKFQPVKVDESSDQTRKPDIQLSATLIIILPRIYIVNLGVCQARAWINIFYLLKWLNSNPLLMKPGMNCCFLNSLWPLTNNCTRAKWVTSAVIKLMQIIGAKYTVPKLHKKLKIQSTGN